MPLMFVLGFASGIPLALTGSTLSAWMVKEGVDIKTIGLFSLVGLPYAFKFLWSPLMDRFVPPFLGRRRGWMIITQLLLIITISAMGFYNPASTPLLIAAMALSLAFFSASQDIVLDAYRTEYLKPEERGAGVGVWIMGYRIAILISGAMALILSDHLSWKMVYLIMGLFMVVGCIATVLAPEPLKINPASESIEPPKSLYEAAVLPFVEFFRRPGALEVLLFIILYKLGDIAAAQMTTPYILGHIGFSGTELGTIYKGFGMAATIAGALIGGAIMSRWSLKKSLLIFGVLQGISTLIFAVLEFTGRQIWALSLVVGTENLCGGMGTAAYTAFLMGLCNKKFTATQYALLSSLMAVGRYVTGAPTGFLADAVGWVMFFVICTALALPGLLLLLRYNKWAVE
ncbi:MAG TPA: AmpG family muropeptide MFS transporter [Syntrophaceae bacterium]|nr:AmpG family muropeptide MFS transporter [Syntrophaceae bacterium]